MKRNVTRVSIILVVVLAALQFVPSERTNPPVESEGPESAEVRSVLRRACYDCHSHETRWPWYAKVAPMSWLVVHHVEEGRGELNFSTWNRVEEPQRRRWRREIWQEVQEGEMPLKTYLPLHPDARLSEADRAILWTWAEHAGGESGDDS